MSKKRKTRKQKETAHIRHSEEIQKLHIHQKAPIYSVTALKTMDEKLETKRTVSINESYEQKDIAYLKHDIAAITAASGIVAAFDILLFVLLSTGFLRLHFLGY